MKKIIKTLCLLLPIVFASFGCLGGSGSSTTGSTTTGTNSGLTGSNSEGPTGTSNPINVSGHWKGIFQETFTDNPKYGRSLIIRETSMDITQNGNIITGTGKDLIDSTYYSGEVNGTIGGNAIRLSMDKITEVTSYGSSAKIRINIEGTINGNAITGTFTRAEDWGSYGIGNFSGNFAMNKI